MLRKLCALVAALVAVASVVAAPATAATAAPASGKVRTPSSCAQKSPMLTAPLTQTTTAGPEIGATLQVKHVSATLWCVRVLAEPSTFTGWQYTANTTLQLPDKTSSWSYNSVNPRNGWISVNLASEALDVYGTVWLAKTKRSGVTLTAAYSAAPILEAR